MKGPLIAVLLIALACSASAQNQPMVYGLGGQTCGKLQAEWKNSPPTRGLSHEWVMGFVTATGLAVKINQASSQAATAFVDEFCATNPDRSLLMASLGYVRTLKVK